MNPDYSGPSNYKSITVRYQRQVIDQLLVDLHAQHEQMLEHALEHSNMQESKDVIAWIKGKL